MILLSLFIKKLNVLVSSNIQLWKIKSNPILRSQNVLYHVAMQINSETVVRIVNVSIILLNYLPKVKHRDHN